MNSQSNILYKQTQYSNKSTPKYSIKKQTLNNSHYYIEQKVPISNVYHNMRSSVNSRNEEQEKRLSSSHLFQQRIEGRNTPIYTSTTFYEKLSDKPFSIYKTN